MGKTYVKKNIKSYWRAQRLELVFSPGLHNNAFEMGIMLPFYTQEC